MRNVLILCALLLAAPVRANLIYVDAHAPGPVHDGKTWATAYLEVVDAEQSAFNASEGAEVWVADGAYGPAMLYSRWWIAVYGGFAGNETRRDERDPARNVCTITGAGSLDGYALRLSAGGVVDGFTFQSGTNGGLWLDNLPQWDATAANNIIHGGRVGINVRSSSAIVDNVISDTSLAAIYTQPNFGGTIRGNVISNAGIGISCEDGWPLADVRDNAISGSRTGMLLGGGVLAANNTVASNGAGIQLSSDDAYSQYTGIYLADNIVAFNTGAGISGWPALSHNDVIGNGPDYADRPPDASDLSINPLFADLARGNVHIQPASPLRNRGENAIPLAGETDMDGQPRVLDGAVDIGADESDGTVWPVAPENIVRVKPGGNDAADGRTWETAKATIQAAVDAAPAGEVWIAAGEYSQPVELTWGTSLYGGFRGDETSRDGRDPARNVTRLAVAGADAISAGGTARGSTVDGLNIVTDGTALRAFSADITVSHVTISARAGILVQQSRARITDSRIRSTTGACVNAGGGALDLARCDLSMAGPAAGYCVVLDDGDSTVRNNVFHGIPDQTQAVGYGILVRGPAKVLNNTLTGFSGAAVTLESPGATLANNILAFNGFSIENRSGYAVTLSHNDVVGNTWDKNLPAGGGGPGDVSLDPRFVNPRGGDFHIEPDSPVRNAGDNAFVVAGDTDMDGQPRILDDRVDIGADESNGDAYSPTRPIYHVRPDGSDDQDGLSWATALKTIQAAVSRATDADVWVAEGVYNEHVSLVRHAHLYGGFAGTETDRSQRDPAANPTVIEWAATSGDAVTASPTVYGGVVDGFTIRSERGAAIQSAADLLITQNRIVGGLQGVSVTGGAPDIYRNRVEGGDAGIYIIGGQPAVRDNLVTGTKNAAIRTYVATDIRNNTVARNAGDGIVCAGERCVVQGNIVAYGGGVGVSLNTDAEMYGWVFYENAGGNFQAPTGRALPSTDPKFVDPDGGDYHLMPDSPAIDIGNSYYVDPGELDLDGHPRVAGFQPDSGAYEFGGALPPNIFAAERALAIVGGMRRPTPNEDFAYNADPTDPAITLSDVIALLRRPAPSGT